MNKFKQRLVSFLSHLKETEPAVAYNIWALQYDDQPGNLMLDLDEALFSALMNKISLENKTVADIGCGTGRHWEKLYAKKPKQIIGFDVSEGMLKILKSKFPNAQTHLLQDNSLQLENSSCDLIISTLALAHITNIEEAFKEWGRVLKSGGDIIITDYHPEALANGGNRTFMHNGKMIAIKNYVHLVDEVKAVATKLGWEMEEISEKKIDASVKHYYEKQDALRTFEKFSGTPIIYGIHLKKTDAVK